MSKSKVGFAVFRQAWEAVTKSFLSERDALGSRLHRAEDGTWIAYAQWPSKAAWRRSRDLGPTNDEWAAIMRAATEEAFEPVLMQPVCDHLVRD